jgi:hypothetical protein
MSKSPEDFSSGLFFGVVGWVELGLANALRYPSSVFDLDNVIHIVGHQCSIEVEME